jgi:hypothetical protein
LASKRFSQHIPVSGGYGHGHQVASPGEEEVRHGQPRAAKGGRAEPKGERQRLVVSHIYFCITLDEIVGTIMNHYEPQYKFVNQMFDHMYCVIET